MPDRVLVPIIDTDGAYTDHVDCILRIDRLGQKCIMTFGAFDRNPSVNAGQLFRTPRVRLIWHWDNLSATRGTLAEWIESGAACHDGTYMVPMLGGVPKREMQ